MSLPPQPEHKSCAHWYAQTARLIFMYIPYTNTQAAYGSPWRYDHSQGYIYVSQSVFTLTMPVLWWTPRRVRGAPARTHQLFLACSMFVWSQICTKIDKQTCIMMVKWPSFRWVMKKKNIYIRFRFIFIYMDMLFGCAQVH